MEKKNPANERIQSDVVNKKRKWYPKGNKFKRQKWNADSNQQRTDIHTTHCI
jgi:hypothetical protein